MKNTAPYHTYPLWIVAASNTLSLSIYILGFHILSRLELYLAFAYLAYILFLEIRIIKMHCVNCFYWGKICAFGKGRLSSWLFKQGESSKFCAKKMTWKDMIPDMLVLLIPAVTGIVILILKFNIWILLSLILIILLSTSGNGFVRGNLACKNCKQAELGCPALDLFSKGK